MTGRITLHVGLPKAGSSAIQTWLRDYRDPLAEVGITVAVARAHGDEIRVTPYADGPINSGGIIHLLRDARLKRDAARSFIEQLTELADRHGHVVLSGEALSQPFWMHDDVVLTEFNKLGQHHGCDVLYYLPPQHRALEAAWRQWGFRSGMSPARYVADRSSHLHYLDAIEVTHEVPDLHVVFRPFVRTHLIENDVIADFASTALDLHQVGDVKPANVGTSLTAANLLATLPEGLLWDSPHDNRHFSRVKKVLARSRGGEDPRAEQGRRVLERWAYDQFDTENRELLDRLGWSPQGWPQNDGGSERDIELLDELWRPSASDAELAILHRLLEAVTADSSA